MSKGPPPSWLPDNPIDQAHETPFGYPAPKLEGPELADAADDESKPEKKTSYTISEDEGHIEMQCVGGFADLRSVVEPVPEAMITQETAGKRLVQLKHKFNELQKKREWYHVQIKAHGGVAAASMVLTGGASVLLHGPAAVHQRNKVKEILAAMRECIEQINGLRESFGESPGWLIVDNSVGLDEEAFKINEISKDELLWGKL